MLLLPLASSLCAARSSATAARSGRFFRSAASSLADILGRPFFVRRHACRDGSAHWHGSFCKQERCESGSTDQLQQLPIACMTCRTLAVFSCHPRIKPHGLGQKTRLQNKQVGRLEARASKTTHDARALRARIVGNTCWKLEVET